MLALLLAVAVQDKPAATPAAIETPAKKICRGERIIGSRLPAKRTCHTQEEWAAIDQAKANRSMDTLQNGRTN